jgi:hypothetical protein
MFGEPGWTIASIYGRDNAAVDLYEKIKESLTMEMNQRYPSLAK